MQRVALKKVQYRWWTIWISEIDNDHLTEKIKNDNENTIGKNIRRLRKEKGLGQTDLVKELQLLDIVITRETLVKIERGIQHIQLAQLKGIKQILDVSYEDLLD